MSYSTSGLVTVTLNNVSATTNPVLGDDETQGYAVQSRWTNTSTNKEYVCLDPATGAAVWTETTGGGGGDVTGPGVAVDENIAVFNLTTGKIIKDGGINISAVTANTAKISYTDAAAVGLNTTHRGSDGKDHSDVVANNAKVTNATHTGDVTGATALTIGAKKVTLAMMADGTDGELITYDATGVAAKVPVGTATHVLTSNGPGAAPTFQAAAGGSAYDWTPQVLNPLIWVRPDEGAIGYADIGVYTLDDTVTPSADGHAQPNNNAAASVTSIIFWDTNAAAVDNSAGFADFVIGDVFRLDDGLGGFTTWEINGTPVDNTTSWTYPVTNVLDDTTMTFPATSETVYMHRATTVANRGTDDFYPAETDITKMPRISSLASQPSLLFDGTDDEMIMTGSFVPSPDTFTIWSVFKNISSSANASVTNYGASLILRQDSAAGGKMLMRVGAVNLDGTVSLTGTHAFMLVQADLVHTLQSSCNFNDGETIQKRITGGVSTSTLSIGSNGSTFFNEMEFCETGICDRQISPDELANLRQYILDRYGI